MYKSFAAGFVTCFVLIFGTSTLIVLNTPEQSEGEAATTASDDYEKQYTNIESMNGGSEQREATSTPDVVPPNATLPVTKIPVSTFTKDGRDGYSLAIPGGNESICTWTYLYGWDEMPYMEITRALSETERHTMLHSGYYDWKVVCVDDWGGYYIGDIPAEAQ